MFALTFPAIDPVLFEILKPEVLTKPNYSTVHRPK